MQFIIIYYYYYDHICEQNFYWNNKVFVLTFSGCDILWREQGIQPYDAKRAMARGGRQVCEGA